MTKRLSVNKCECPTNGAFGKVEEQYLAAAGSDLLQTPDGTAYVEENQLVAATIIVQHPVVVSDAAAAKEIMEHVVGSMAAFVATESLEAEMTMLVDDNAHSCSVFVAAGLVEDAAVDIEVVVLPSAVTCVADLHPLNVIVGSEDVGQPPTAAAPDDWLSTAATTYEANVLTLVAAESMPPKYSGTSLIDARVEKHGGEKLIFF